jgi:hypothetical protein
VTTTPVLDRPTSDGAVVREVAAGTTLDVLARYADYVWVDSDARRPAWVLSP